MVTPNIPILYSSPEATIEVFIKKADLDRRYDYIKALSDGSPIFQQYIYKSETMLFRLPYKLAPEAAAKYEEAFLRPAK